MPLVVGAVAIVYPRLAAWADLPRWFAGALIAAGALVGVSNLAVVVLA